MTSVVFQSGFQVESFNVPYISFISGGLQAGKAIFIQGTIPPQSNSFVVQLKCGQSERDDIAFQIKPDFSSNSLVFNSRQNGSWGKEEKLALPLQKGSTFDLIIVVNAENYQVFLNRGEVGRFKHRLPLETVTYLDIGGQVSLSNVVFIGSWAGFNMFEAGGMMFQGGGVTFDQGQSEITCGPGTTTQKLIQLNLSPGQSVSILNPVQNPKLPYTGPILGGLKAGMALYLQGVAKGDRFAVNFKTGQSDKDDIAFHFNPRYNANVVMNTCRNGGWEAEEYGPDNPFKIGEAFEMFIVIRPDGYQVYVNGKEHYLYKHRISLEKVSALNIVGDVVVKLVGFIQNWYSLGFLRWGLSTIQSEFSFLVQNPALPYVGPIPEGLKSGLALYFHGIAGTTGDRFAINFKTGQADSNDIAFHFNPRYNAKVVMNSFRNGGWEVEEYGPDNPFKMGEAFEIFIVIKPEGYQVYVNDREYYLFKHRIPLAKVTALNICGNVVLNLFAFIRNWSTSSFVTKLRGFLRWSSSTIQSELSHPVQNPAIPYMGLISGGLRAGMAFYLHGVAWPKGERFAVNFKTGQSDKDDIAFHYNPRYNSMVVMNTCRNRGWEAEEYGPDNPFKMGEAFEIIIVFKSEGYQVYVNGKEHYLYKHRIPLEKVSAVNITADVVVNLCGFIRNWSKCSIAIEGMKILHPGSAQCKLTTIQ